MLVPLCWHKGIVMLGWKPLFFFIKLHSFVNNTLEGTGSSNGSIKMCVAAARPSFYSVFGKWPVFFSVKF